MILSYTVQQGNIAIIKKLAIIHFGGNPPDGSGNVVWQVLINGGAVKGMNNMLSQFGTLAVPKDCQIVIYENDTIQVLVTVPAGKVGASPGSTAASFDGFTYPLSEAVNTPS